MITGYVPGAYMTHDMLHMRGGHQVSWLIDGVEIPNTNIGSNLAAQIDPKDIDYLEIQRGSYTSDVGDRTYGVFNVVPRTGFERNRQAELILSAGNFLQTNDQINFGDHNAKFAWYTSLNGNRSDFGLAPPVGQVAHDAANGFGGFASLIYNRTPKDQLRLITQLRQDFFEEFLYDPDATDLQNTQEYQSRRSARHAARARMESPRFRGCTFNPTTMLQLALLSLQPGELYLAALGHASRDHSGSHLALRRRTHLAHQRGRSQHAAGRHLLLRSARRLFLWRQLQRQEREAANSRA